MLWNEKGVKPPIPTRDSSERPSLGNNGLIILQNIFLLIFLAALWRCNWCAIRCMHSQCTIWHLDTCAHLQNLHQNQDTIHHPPKFPWVLSNPSFLPRRHLSSTHSNPSISVRTGTLLSTKRMIRAYLLESYGGVPNVPMHTAMPAHHHSRSVLPQKMSPGKWASPIAKKGPHTQRWPVG